MKTDALKTFEKGLWTKGIILGLGMSVMAYFIGLLMNRVSHDSTLNPIFLSILVFFWGLSLPLLAKVFSPAKRRTSREYEEADEAFEEEANGLILEAFGPELFQQLYLDDLNSYPSVGIDICTEMLRSDKSSTSPDLRFYLFAKMAKYYARDKRPTEAIGSLRAALSIKPANLIANYRIATLFESLGSGNDAITHYERALEDKTVSPSLEAYMAKEIQRVRVSGPRQKGPWDDSGFQWFTG